MTGRIRLWQCPRTSRVWSYHSPLRLWRASALLLWALCAICITARATDDLTKPIQASPDGHYLVQPDGKPFFWLGDTAWELFHRLDREETEQYLQKRARQGFNVIQAVATGELDYAGLTRPNRQGEVPFIDADPARPNARYFEHVDWVLNRAAHHGLRIAMLPVWGAFFVSDSRSRVFDEAKAEAYGRWIGHRYRGKGVIWVLGGDTNPIYPKDSKPSPEGKAEFSSVIDYRPVYDAMAKGIISGEGGNPFITYHPTISSPSGAAIPRMSLYFGDREWLDLSMLQSSHALVGSGEFGGGSYVGGGFMWNPRYNYVPVFDEYRAVPSRPVIDGETRYEDHPILTDFKWKEKAKEFWRAHDTRNAIYHSLFAGAAGYTYGHFNVWDFYEGKPRQTMIEQLFAPYERAPWQQALDAPGAGQMRYAKALMLSRPYFTRIPDQSLIVGDQGEGEKHIGATRDRQGGYAMLYLPQGQSVTVDLSKLNGPRVIGWWYNPRTGIAQKMNKMLSTAEKPSLVPPSQGADQDWVLVLDSERSRFGAPGAAQ